MAQLPTYAESLRRIESKIETMIPDWERNAVPTLEAYRELERFIQNLDIDRFGTWTAEDRQQADRLPLHRQMLVIPSDLSPYVSAYTDHLFAQLDNFRDQALETTSITNRVESALADLIDAGEDCLRFARRRRESSEQPTPPKSGVRRTERDRLVIATNTAQQCLNLIGKYLVLAKAPAVQRAAPEFLEGVREEVRGFGWEQALRQPLQAMVQHVGQHRSECLRLLSPFANQPLVHEWDAWSDSVNELAIVIARDLWNEVQRCERDFGAEAAWGDYTLGNGQLFDHGLPVTV